LRVFIAKGLAMSIEENRGVKRIHFSIEGLDGLAEERSPFWVFHGAFASHTGYGVLCINAIFFGQSSVTLAIRGL